MSILHLDGLPPTEDKTIDTYLPSKIQSYFERSEYTLSLTAWH